MPYWHGGSTQINGENIELRDRLMQIWPIGLCNGAKGSEWGLGSAFQKALLDPRTAIQILKNVLGSLSHITYNN